VVVLYLRGIPFSVSAAVGFVSLFGVAVMAGVLYLTEINRQRRDYERPLKEAVLVGACAQFRPLLLRSWWRCWGSRRRRSPPESARTFSGLWRRSSSEG
jgi:Cu/Ag efflux pump CusA